MVNDIELKDLNGNTYAHVCECGMWYWPWISMGPNLGSVRVECPCNGKSGRKTHGGRQIPYRLKYKKTPKTQTTMDGRNLRQVFWGKK